MITTNRTVKQLISFALAMVFCAKLSAQPPSIASLLLRLKLSPADTSRISLYKSLILAYRGTKPDSAQFFARQGLAFAQKINSELGIGIMQTQLGALNNVRGNIDSAKAHLTIALSLFEKLQYQPGLVAAHNSMGICLGKSGSYKEAAQHFLAALKINQQRNDIGGLVQSYLKLGVLNEQINNLDKALEYYQKALAMNKQKPSLSAESTLLNDIGIIHGKKGEMKDALKYFLAALKVAVTNDPEALSLMLGNAGDAYQQLGNSKKAFDYQNEALKIARQFGFKEAEATTLINLASLKTNTKPDTALIMLEQALAITHVIHQHHLRLDVYTGLIDVYKRQNDFKAATNMLEKRDLLKDSLFTLKNAKDIANLIATNELANSKIKMQTLQLNAVRAKFQTDIILAIAISAVVILMVVALFLYKTNNLNKQLLYQQEELRSLSNFKDKLFSTISHDLRSPIATIVNLLSILEDGTDVDEIRTFIPRLKQHSRSTLEVMDKLLIWGQSQLKGATQNSTHFNLKTLIIQSLNLHQEAADQKQIKLIDNTPDTMPIYADSSHVEFVIRNILANAIKYTHTGGLVEVSATTDETSGYTTIAIKDNGIGIEQSLQARVFEPGNQSIAGTESEKGNSIGLMLCKEFVDRNGGKIWLESELGKGTCFYVSFKQG